MLRTVCPPAGDAAENPTLEQFRELHRQKPDDQEDVLYALRHAGNAAG